MATHDDIHDVVAVIAWVPDQRRADLVLSRARVQTLGDMVVADHTSESNVAVAPHVPGHATAKAARLKEETCAAVWYP